jgi:hypothetical protein
VATLTYVYSDSTAVVGPLATFAEPHSYDLCEEHAVRLTVPRGWEVMRHVGDFPAPIPHADDLEALADAVREAGRYDTASRAAALAASGTSSGMSAARDTPHAATATATLAAGSARRGHLRVVPPTR